MSGQVATTSVLFTLDCVPRPLQAHAPQKSVSARLSRRVEVADGALTTAQLVAGIERVVHVPADTCTVICFRHTVGSSISCIRAACARCAVSRQRRCTV